MKKYTYYFANGERSTLTFGPDGELDEKWLHLLQELDAEEAKQNRKYSRHQSHADVDFDAMEDQTFNLNDVVEKMKSDGNLDSFLSELPTRLGTVAGLLAQGYSRDDICKRLHVSRAYICKCVARLQQEILAQKIGKI